MTERPDPLARARAAALAELRQAPVAVSWQRQAAVVAAVWAGVAVLAGAATVLAGAAGLADVAARAPFLLMLLATAVLGSVAALAPRGRWTWVMLAIVPAVMALIAFSRRAGLPSATPGWVCSVNHVGLGLAPLAAALWAVRRAAWRWPRVLAAGLGAGTAGSFLGELACHQGPRHFLVHHVGAWAVIALLCLLVSRRLEPRSFAP